MSFRYRTRTFSLPKFVGWFGCGRGDVIDAGERWLAAHVTDPETEGERAQFREALRRAVDHGVPFPGLDAETRMHDALATFLAWHRQRPRPCGSDDYKLSGFSEFERHFGAAMGAERDLMGFLLRGRPVFGLRIGWDGGFYGYLTLQEARRLRAALTKAVPEGDRRKADLARDVSGEIARWCDAAVVRRKDLWYWIS